MRKLRVAVLAGLVLALLPAAAADARVPRGFFGLTYGFYPDVPDADLNRMANGGVREVRWSLSWPRIEPQEGNFRWAQVSDPVIGALASRGIRTLPTVVASPGWAVGGASGATPPLSPGARAAWANFLREAVKRYGPGGTYWSGACCPLSGGYPDQYPQGARPKPIRTWQIWNEVNLPGAFDPPKPKKYARLLRVSDKAINSVHPRAKIALSGVPGFVDYKGWNYLDDLYRIRGIKRRFDLVAFHPYAPTVRKVGVQLEKVRRVMKRHHDKKTRLWVSEMGWGSARRDGNLNAGRKGQAKRLSQSFRLLRSERKHWRIKRVSWFTWRDPQFYGGQCRWCPFSGLIGKAGDPKPSWRAFKRFTPGN
jgi:hypothetical protein